MTEDIFCAASLYTGAEGKEAAILQELCTAAECRLRKLLLPDVDEKEIYESFVTAAAMLAAADFSAIRAGSGMSHLTAGPVSITRDDRSRAQSLREQAMLIMGPWCRDAFCFLGVEA